MSMYRNDEGTTETRTAVVVDPFSSGSMIAPELVGKEISSVAVVSSPDLTKMFAGSYRPQDFQTIIHFDGDVLGLVKELERFQPEFIVPGGESGVELADQLSMRLNPHLANIPNLRTARRDKGAMGDALAGAGVPRARQICTNDSLELKDWLVREGLAEGDVMVKPPRSAGTDDVRRTTGLAATLEAFNALVGKVNRLGLRNEAALVQEYLRGVEYVVDTFSHNRRHTVTNVCRYTKVPVAGGTAAYVRMDFLPPIDAVVGPLVGYVFSVLDAVGIQHGPGHSEVMMTANGPRLIETAARMHGGGHPRYARRATGDSQLDRLVRFFADGVGADSLPERYTLLNHTTVKFLAAPRGGIVRNANILSGVRSLPSYFDAQGLVQDGQTVSRSIDLFTILGFVVLSHPDPSQVERDYATVTELEKSLLIQEEES
jgi:hypothetical protein